MCAGVATAVSRRVASAGGHARKPGLPHAVHAAQAARTAQSGQALIFIVALLPAVIASVFMVFNAAVATRDKMKLQNTADATTYSASVLTARSLNFLAYTNRAMAANEASIATLASVQTTTGMLITSAANIQEGRVIAEALEAARNLARSFEPDAGPAAFAAYLENVARAHALQRMADRIAGFVVPATRPLQIAVDTLRVLDQGISAGQAAMLASTVAQMPQVIADVMKANDPDTRAAPGETAILASRFVADLGTYLDSYHQSAAGPFSRDEFDEVLRFAHAAQATRDEWTKKRRFLPEWASWIATGLAGSLAAITTQRAPGLPSLGSLTGDVLGGIVEWKGGTELVAEEPGIAGDHGRIRWQSADAIEIGLPLGLLYTDIVGGAADIARGKFGLGAGAAIGDARDVRRSWEGRRLTLPDYAREARTYGGLNDDKDGMGVMVRGAFERAAADRDGLVLPGAFPALVFDARLHYGPRTGIGTGLTRDWSMPRYIDVKRHPPMVAHAADAWFSSRNAAAGNPRGWGPNTDTGPALTMVMQKGASPLRVVSTAQVYFRRPQDRWSRRDHSADDPPTLGRYDFAFTGGYVEHRSLFSPYWHPHNVEPSPWARALAMGGSALAHGLQPDAAP